MQETAVKLINVTKSYVLHHEKPTFAEGFMQGTKNESFTALQNVNLDITLGESVGIIGPNGSGKTTLLKIIAGITAPSSGVRVVNGRLVSLIGLTAGFQPDLTGEENVFLNGSLLGMSRKEIKQKMSKIVSFANLRNFIDTPLYTYSSGMMLRLGFSVAVHTDPDIILVDEVFSVGDEKFKVKSGKKMLEFRKKKKTMLVVSHNLDYIEENCKRCVWVERGMVVMSGPSKEVIKSYKKHAAST